MGTCHLVRDRDDPSKVRMGHLPAGHVVTTAVVPAAAVVVSLEGMQSSQVARHPTMTSAGSHGGATAMFAHLQTYGSNGPVPNLSKTQNWFSLFLWFFFTGKQLCLMARNYGILQFLPPKPIQ